MGSSSVLNIVPKELGNSYSINEYFGLFKEGVISSGFAFENRKKEIKPLVKITQAPRIEWDVDVGSTFSRMPIYFTSQRSVGAKQERRCPFLWFADSRLVSKCDVDEETFQIRLDWGGDSQEILYKIALPFLKNGSFKITFKENDCSDQPALELTEKTIEDFLTAPA